LFLRDFNNQPLLYWLVSPNEIHLARAGEIIAPLNFGCVAFDLPGSFGPLQ
jgi:hypothetical protein